MSAEQLRHALGEVLGTLDDVRAHNAAARELLEDYRRVVTEAQARPDAWLPDELARAVEQLDANRARIDGAEQMIDHYRSRV
ncbi:hypothetical protein [Saccharomonospora iraqiensis]|uniref:hypothetical protein n=1 Tax=Saccharomonospora iraqiensis TaxID=52698 RepID=UPI000428122E|nr:hypothetical protein [Saccharomonospora iraqiensis]